MDKHTFTVTELNNRIKGIIELDSVLSDVCVRGELSNYKIYPSGHHYFSLKDAESSIRCVMFKSSAAKLRFRPESGMGVTAFGRISVYPRDGAYQLYCSGLIPEGTGDLQIAFEQLKKKLSEEGLFDAKYKKPLPQFPERIAIITSSAGAAVHDMIRILNHRWPMAKVLLLPVRVQGVEAPAEIVGAIKYANEFKVADVIITGRGGGSIEDLWAFNEEMVARAVAASAIPIISAVGHETDFTICDFVADLRAPTPSAAAELAVPDRARLWSQVQMLQSRLITGCRGVLTAAEARLKLLKDKRCLSAPQYYTEEQALRLDYLTRRFASAAQRQLGTADRRLAAAASKLDALSPLKVLGRGYAIGYTADGGVLDSVTRVKAGDSVSLKLADGTVDCTVTNMREEM